MKKNITLNELKQFGISFGFILWLITLLSFLKHNVGINFGIFLIALILAGLAFSRKTILYIATTILGVLMWIKFVKGIVSGHFLINLWLFGIAQVSILLAIVKPAVLRPAYYILIEKIAHSIGWFNTRVILVIIYYLILTPVSVIMRIFGKDLLDAKAEKGRETFWHKREKNKADKEGLLQQF